MVVQDAVQQYISFLKVQCCLSPLVIAAKEEDSEEQSAIIKKYSENLSDACQAPDDKRYVAYVLTRLIDNESDDAKKKWLEFIRDYVNKNALKCPSKDPNLAKLSMSSLRKCL